MLYGHRAYLEAVEEAFGADIDYGMLVKLYGAETGGQGHKRKYSPSECLGLARTRSPATLIAITSAPPIRNATTSPSG
jgi:hypothetical protein